MPLVADFNHDGKLDVLTFGASTICLRLGKGDGTFADPLISYPFQYPSFFNLADAKFAHVADLNGDGYPDIVVGDLTAARILMNQRDGTFTMTSGFQLHPASSHETQLIIYAAAVGPTSSSGFPDVVLITSDNFQTTVNTYKNDGTGSFSSTPVVSSYTSSADLSGGPTVALGDVNRDGKPDLVIETQAQ